MALQMYAYWTTLLQLASEEAEARASGDEARFAAAAARHDDYKALCLRDDVELVLPTRRGEVW